MGENGASPLSHVVEKGPLVFWLVLFMLIVLALGIFVIGVVAIPARRAGRALFTPRGHRVIRASRSRAANVRVPQDAKSAISQRLPRRASAADDASEK